MDTKNIVATVYIKDGKAVHSPSDFTEAGDVLELCRLYNDSGIDKIILFDLSDSDEEHEKNISIIKTINRRTDIKVCAGGHINQFEDVKKLLYAGCMQVIMNGAKKESLALAQEACARFGKDRMLVSIKNVDFIFKNQEIMEGCFHELLVMEPGILDAVENITEVPHVVIMKEFDYEAIVRTLKRKNVRGIAGGFLNDTNTDIMKLKSTLSSDGITMDNFAPVLQWSDLKKNSDGLVPVIVQDYRTDEVLMLAYMNEEAFLTTIHIGKMTYYSRSRQELWTKGLTSGHIQYVKSLTADCDYDTILAKVSQIGAACHTGSRNCFFHPIVQKQYTEKNALKVFEYLYRMMEEHKNNPSKDVYPNQLFEGGVDPVLQKLGEETARVIISAKNPQSEHMINEISDLLYQCMLLMVEKGVTWEDITTELAQR